MAMVEHLMVLSAVFCLSKRLSSHWKLSLKMEEDNDDTTTETKTM